MQSTTSRGARRLLVTAGAMTLGLSVVAPAIVSADTGRGAPQAEEKVWVCLPVPGKPTFLLNHVALSAVGPAGVAVDESGLALLEGIADKSDLAALGRDAATELAAAVCGEGSTVSDEEDEGDEIDPDPEEPKGGGADPDKNPGLETPPPGLGDQDPPGLGGPIPGTGELTPPHRDDTIPGNTNPGNTNPGNTNPGNTNPGNTNPGNTGTDPANGDGGSAVEGDDVTVTIPATPADPGAPGEPATPAVPAEPDRSPRSVIISTDAVERPVEVEAPAVADENEVLGVTTTRTPTPAVAASGSEVAAQTVTGTLPRTGADGTRGLVAAGGALALAGLAFEAASRRRKDAQAGGQLSAS